ncbi:MAG: preprotein translocase subunit SecE [Candidatus Limivivens sp.]|nr:preprotein translocase subunit SecE [Candidatus Limivivens sp.]
MEESKGKKAPKKNWIDGLKSEYRKIIWPDKTDLAKQTAAVVVVSAVLGVIITMIDFAVQYGIDFLMK